MRKFLKYIKDCMHSLAGCEFFKLLIYSWRIDKIRRSEELNAIQFPESLERLVFPRIEYPDASPVLQLILLRT